ncbi:reverse transcriptase domain-containing protein [Tanacetum coccineum]
MGHRTRRTLNRIQAKECDQSTSPRRLLGENSRRRQRNRLPGSRRKKVKHRMGIYTDGASSDNSSGTGLMIVNLEGMEFTYAQKIEFTATNNEAEYEAVIACPRIAKEMKIEEIIVFVAAAVVVLRQRGDGSVGDMVVWR